MSEPVHESSVGAADEAQPDDFARGNRLDLRRRPVELRPVAPVEDDVFAFRRECLGTREAEPLARRADDRPTPGDPEVHAANPDAAHSSWARIDWAASTSVRSLLKAVTRGRYFIPQSGATTRRSGATRLEATSNASLNDFNRLDLRGLPSRSPRARSPCPKVVEDSEIDLRLCGLDRDLPHRVSATREKCVAGWLLPADDCRVTEAEVDGGGDRDAIQARLIAVTAYRSAASGSLRSHGSSS